MPHAVWRGTLTGVPTIPDRVRAAAARWRLTVGDQLTGGSRSAVYAVSDELGRDLVLKLPAAPTDAADVAAAEAAALTGWIATGAAATLVAATGDALLLSRVRPGTALPWPPRADTVEVVAAVLRRLWSAPSGWYRYRMLADVYQEEERIAREDAASEQLHRREPDRGRPGLELLPAAAHAVRRLLTTTATPVLLHGDLINKNLLRDEASPVGFVAIDPQPRLGDPAADVGAFAASQPAGQILPIAAALASAVDVDPRRAAIWAAVWATHQTAQAWRDDQTALEHLVSSATIQGLLHHQPVWR